MDTIDSQELWRKIPVEEKLSLVANAQSLGTLTFISFVCLCATFAIAFQTPWIFWCSFLIGPFTFQYASGRRYRRAKPAVMLSYLAARSVARRFAYTLNHEDLTLRLVFKGYAYRVITPEENFEGENDPNATAQFPVWIALIGSSVVVLTEEHGGAKPVFRGILSEKMQIETLKSAPGEYTRDKELQLSYEDRKVGPQKIVLGSNQAAALITFERICMLEHEKALAATVENDEL